MRSQDRPPPVGLPQPIETGVNRVCVGPTVPFRGFRYARLNLADLVI